MGTTTSWVWANGEGDSVGGKLSNSIGFIGIRSGDETIGKDVRNGETINKDVGINVRVMGEKTCGMGGLPIRSNGVDSSSRITPFVLMIYTSHEMITQWVEGW
jgi:hypothetical protein